MHTIELIPWFHCDWLYALSFCLRDQRIPWTCIRLTPSALLLGDSPECPCLTDLRSLVRTVQSTGTNLCEVCYHISSAFSTDFYKLYENPQNITVRDTFSPFSLNCSYFSPIKRESICGYAPSFKIYDGISPSGCHPGFFPPHSSRF